MRCLKGFRLPDPKGEAMVLQQVRRGTTEDSDEMYDAVWIRD